MNSLFVVLLAVTLSMCYASPKKYQAGENFEPNNRYYESTLPTRNTTKIESKEGRFGIPLSSFGSSGSGVQYGNNGVGYTVSPVKIDIGGVALGALIGLGAVLIVPKLTSLLSGGYGYRSLDNNVSSFTEILGRIDNSLEQHNIDSSSCAQRVVCNYVNDAQKNIQNGEGTNIDQIIYTLTNNTLLTQMLDGTAIQEAVKMGREGSIEKCAQLYTKCPISRDNVMKVIASFLPA